MKKKKGGGGGWERRGKVGGDKMEKREGRRE